MLFKLFVESLQNSVGSGGVVIAKYVLHLALSSVGVLVVVVEDEFSQTAERPREDEITVIELFHRGTVWAVQAKSKNSDPIGPSSVGGACLGDVVR